MCRKVFCLLSVILFVVTTGLMAGSTDDFVPGVIVICFSAELIGNTVGEISVEKAGEEEEYIWETGIAYVTSLQSNFPNPFNPKTTIRFSIGELSDRVNISIYNIRG